MADNFFGLTDAGRVRTNNEDAFIAQKLGRYIAACVIDGVGGYEGGEVAAAIARKAVLDYFAISSGDVITMMKEAFAVANEKIAAEKIKNPDYQSMACVATLAMIDVAAKTFSYAHIGDTRLYLLRDRSLVKISKDQSFVGYLEDSGRITEGEAMQHPKRNEINNALGFAASLNAADIETGTSPFLPGDTVLLCSDGLTDLLTRSEIETVLSTDETLQVKAKKLIQQANDRGGKDNITTVLVHNHRKPTVQKATKPAEAALKKSVTETSQRNTTPTIPAKKKPARRKGTTLVLGIFFLLLILAAAAWLFEKDRITGFAKRAMATGESHGPGRFQQKLDSNTATQFSPPDSLLSAPVAVDDTIWIRRDSLHLQGNGMRFSKSSTYNGPAIAVSDSCKYVLLENLSFENFDVGVLVQNKALHLKNVRFINCRVPVQSQMLFPDNVPVSGAIQNFFAADSLHN